MSSTAYVDIELSPRVDDGVDDGVDHADARAALSGLGDQEFLGQDSKRLFVKRGLYQPRKWLLLYDPTAYA